MDTSSDNLTANIEVSPETNGIAMESNNSQVSEFYDCHIFCRHFALSTKITRLVDPH